MIGAGLGATSPSPDFTRGETVLIVGALPGSIAAATGGLVRFLNPGHCWEVRLSGHPDGPAPAVESGLGGMTGRR